MTRGANRFGAVVSAGESQSPPVTDLAGELDPDTPRAVAAESGSEATAATAAAELRAHGERVRRRELDTALSRLEASGASGDLTPEERRILAQLSASIADALVEQWVAELGADGVDEDAAVDLFSE